MSPRETTPNKFFTFADWQSGDVETLHHYDHFSCEGFRFYRCDFRANVINSGDAFQFRPFVNGSQNIKFSDDAHDGAIVLSDRHSTLLLVYKLKRDISVGGVSLAEIAGCVIISVAILSSMINHILSYLTGNGVCPVPENYLLTYY
jgi:hypothetical protein